MINYKTIFIIFLLGLCLWIGFMVYKFLNYSVPDEVTDPEPDPSTVSPSIVVAEKNSIEWSPSAEGVAVIDNKAIAIRNDEPLILTDRGQFSSLTSSFNVNKFLIKREKNKISNLELNPFTYAILDFYSVNEIIDTLGNKNDFKSEITDNLKVKNSIIVCNLTNEKTSKLLILAMGVHNDNDKKLKIPFTSTTENPINYKSEDLQKWQKNKNGIIPNQIVRNYKTMFFDNLCGQQGDTKFYNSMLYTDNTGVKLYADDKCSYNSVFIGTTDDASYDYFVNNKRFGDIFLPTVSYYTVTPSIGMAPSTIKEYHSLSSYNNSTVFTLKKITVKKMLSVKDFLEYTTPDNGLRSSPPSTKITLNYNDKDYKPINLPNPGDYAFGIRLEPYLSEKTAYSKDNQEWLFDYIYSSDIVRDTYFKYIQSNGFKPIVCSSIYYNYPKDKNYNFSQKEYNIRNNIITGIDCGYQDSSINAFSVNKIVNYLANFFYDNNGKLKDPKYLPKNFSMPFGFSLNKDKFLETAYEPYYLRTFNELWSDNIVTYIQANKEDTIDLLLNNLLRGEKLDGIDKILLNTLNNLSTIHISQIFNGFCSLLPNQNVSTNEDRNLKNEMSNFINNGKFLCDTDTDIDCEVGKQSYTSQVISLENILLSKPTNPGKESSAITTLQPLLELNLNKDLFVPLLVLSKGHDINIDFKTSNIVNVFSKIYKSESITYEYDTNSHSISKIENGVIYDKINKSLTNGDFMNDLDFNSQKKITIYSVDDGSFYIIKSTYENVAVFELISIFCFKENYSPNVVTFNPDGSLIFYNKEEKKIFTTPPYDDRTRTKQPELKLTLNNDKYIVSDKQNSWYLLHYNNKTKDLIIRNNLFYSPYFVDYINSPYKNTTTSLEDYKRVYSEYCSIVNTGQPRGIFDNDKKCACVLKDFPNKNNKTLDDFFVNQYLKGQETPEKILPKLQDIRKDFFCVYDECRQNNPMMDFNFSEICPENEAICSTITTIKNSSNINLNIDVNCAIDSNNCYEKCDFYKGEKCDPTTGKCALTCTETQNCPGYKICIDGFCKNCENDVDCPPGFGCYQDRCVKTCQTNTDCENGESNFCWNKSCVECRDVNDCAPGYDCIQNSCVLKK